MVSLSAWRAWIEMFIKVYIIITAIVALRLEGVD